MEKIEWFITLLVFNILLIVFTGYYGGYINETVATVDTQGSDWLNLEFDIITGFSNVPTWLNLIFTIQFLVLAYIGISVLSGNG